jgi:hypothetical protein
MSLLYLNQSDLLDLSSLEYYSRIHLIFMSSFIFPQATSIVDGSSKALDYNLKSSKLIQY